MSSKEYFEQVAGQWDSMRQSFFSDAVREKAYQVAGAAAGQSAADLGAGTGFVTEGLLARGLRVVAVDQSPAMLEVLRSRLADAGALDCRVGEAESLPLDNDAVDYVFANMYLHHVEEPPAAIREMVRILKPGGKLVITDLDEHAHEFLRAEQHDRWLGFRREDVRRWFEEAGLTGATTDCVGANCRSPSASGAEHATVGIFAAFGQKPIPGNSAPAE